MDHEKQQPIKKLIWLIKQKSLLQQDIYNSINNQNRTKEKLKRAKLLIINRQWYALVTKLQSNNCACFDKIPTLK